ncbi:MAG: phosphoribosylglycinamide formyltransferase [Tissierellia bacterium]|nr:phosphoribosylglycinamide formyltransferase [Tissierellia bacterium]
MSSIKIAVLVSGSGSNLQSLIDKQGKDFNGEISLVISNIKDAYALERARNHGIKAQYISRKYYTNPREFDQRLLEILLENEIDLVVLAGYLKIITDVLVDRFENRIINIHPSLLPSFGGKGYYGIKVHEAVLERGCKVSGATVHFVDNGADTGPIICQESLNIDQKWDANELQKQVLKIEHEILPKAVKLFCEDRLVVENNRVYIKE